MNEVNEPKAQIEAVPLDCRVSAALSWLRSSAFVVSGLLLWMLGLAALDVPGGLPQWRHVVGASLLVVAVHLWRKASDANVEITGE